MTYQEAEDYLFSQLPMYQKQGAKAFKADLSNITTLCHFLGNPHYKFKTIHIAGTNGKGSTAHSLSSILQEAGYKTGLYTSPHLQDYKERIKINGIKVSESFVIDFIEKLKNIIPKLRPTFFEITVAMAFDYFASEAIEIAVIETGLGGRLDSTNIILPLLCIITSISYDHTAFLGDTLPKIAKEKAGIFKDGVPVVLSKDLPEEAKAVFLDVAGSCHSLVNDNSTRNKRKFLLKKLTHNR